MPRVVETMRLLIFHDGTQVAKSETPPIYLGVLGPPPFVVNIRTQKVAVTITTALPPPKSRKLDQVALCVCHDTPEDNVLSTTNE
jgi:hypothetical protein